MTAGLFPMLDLAERLCVTVETELESSAGRDPIFAPLGLWDGLGGIVAAIIQLKHGTAITVRTERACRRYLEVSRQFVATAPAPIDHGLLGGRVGLLLCATGAAEFLNSEFDRVWLRNSTAQLCAHMMQHPTTSVDFAMGVAGSICGMIGLAKKHGVECRALVESLSRQLVQQLGLTPVGVAFFHATIKNTGPICGLAHGLSGLAVALLDAGLYLGSEMLELLAETVLNTELRLQHPDWLWPDARDRDGEDVPATSGKRKIWKSASTSWCYGTCGLGLSLAFFAQRKKSMQHQRLSESVIDETIKFLDRQARPSQEFCVCHGVGSLLALLNSSKIERKRVVACRTSYLPSVDRILHAAADENTLLVNQAFFEHRLPTTKHPTVSRASYFTGLAGLVVVRHQILREVGPYALGLPFAL